MPAILGKPRKDLTGQKFGKLTVIKLSDKRIRGLLAWECNCECGNTKITTATCLKFGKTKSCGCLENKPDLTGKKFNRLTVIKDTGKRYMGKSVIWLCRCDCGNYRENLTHPLRIGLIKSCGCLKREKATRYRDNNPNWKGMNANIFTGSGRAIRWYPNKMPCEICSSRDSERHHKDGNKLNNESDNIQWLCRKCHMITDGRMEKLIIRMQTRFQYMGRR